MRRVQRYINKIKWIGIPEIEIQIVILDIAAGGRERVGIQAQMKSTSATDTNLVRLWDYVQLHRGIVIHTGTEGRTYAVSGGPNQTSSAARCHSLASSAGPIWVSGECMFQWRKCWFLLSRPSAAIWMKWSDSIDNSQDLKRWRSSFSFKDGIAGWVCLWTCSSLECTSFIPLMWMETSMAAFSSTST